MDDIKIDVPTAVVDELVNKGKARLDNDYFCVGYTILYHRESDITDEFLQPTYSFINLNSYSINRLRKGEVVCVTFNNAGKISTLELQQK